MQAGAILKKTIQVFLFANIFAIEATFRHSAFLDRSIDWQVIFKMGLWGVTFLFCIAHYRHWAAGLGRLESALLAMLIMLVFFSCFYAPDMIYSLGAAFSFISVLMLMMVAAQTLSSKEIITPFITASVLVMALSLAAYFIFPDFARMKEWVGGEQVTGARLTGICGAANTAGAIAALCLLVLVFTPVKKPGVYFSAIVLNAIVLVLSDSRTAMAALLLSLIATWLIKAGMAGRALVFFAVAGIAASFLVIDMESLLGPLSRTGNAAEILTGRVEIWAAVVSLIEQKPFFGWGYAGGSDLIPAAADQVGFAASHAHNAFLQVALSLGMTGLFVFMALLAVLVFHAFHSKSSLNIALVLFLLLGSLTEPVAFTGLATSTVLAFALAIALTSRGNYETGNIAYQQRLSRLPAT